MNKYRLQFQVTLAQEGYGAGMQVMETLEVKTLTFFQVCVILGGLQALIDHEKEMAQV